MRLSHLCEAAPVQVPPTHPLAPPICPSTRFTSPLGCSAPAAILTLQALLSSPAAMAARPRTQHPQNNHFHRTVTLRHRTVTELSHHTPGTEPSPFGSSPARPCVVSLFSTTPMACSPCRPVVTLCFATPIWLLLVYYAHPPCLPLNSYLLLPSPNFACTTVPRTFLIVHTTGKKQNLQSCRPCWPLPLRPSCDDTLLFA